MASTVSPAIKTAVVSVASGIEPSSLCTEIDVSTGLLVSRQRSSRDWKVSCRPWLRAIRPGEHPMSFSARARLKRSRRMDECPGKMG